MLPNLQSLSSLVIAGCTAADSLEYLRGLQQLTSLDLGSLIFEQGSDQTHYFKHLSALTNLKQLAVPNTRLDVQDLNTLSGLSGLQELNIAGCSNLGLTEGPLPDFKGLFTGLTQLTALQVSLQTGDALLLQLNMSRASLSLRALAKLPLEAVRIWKDSFPVAGQLLAARQGHVVPLDTLAGIYEAHHERGNGVDFVPHIIRRAMVQASTMYQDHEEHHGSFLVPII